MFSNDVCGITDVTASCAQPPQQDRRIHATLVRVKRKKLARKLSKLLTRKPMAFGSLASRQLKAVYAFDETKSR